MDTEKILKQATQVIDQCVAIGVVDINSGKLIAMNTTATHPTNIIEVISTATIDLFSGQNIQAAEKLFKQIGKSQTSKYYFQEIIVNSDDLIHFFLRDQNNQNHVGVFICSNKVILGMVLNQVRHIMPAIIDSIIPEAV